VRGSPCLDETLGDSDIERLEDQFEEKENKDMTLGHLMSLDFHISFDWPCLGPLPSPLEMLHFILVIQITINGLCLHIITSLLDH